ncbi:MAG: 50S ribosomal protein L24 [Oscillospiraceae bacterium]|jgi:large subunit ribosomal protein L24|nr:50S ribosomal protein L24 [Oscillospiraceae bacterium]
MNSLNIRKGDTVIVLSGKDKGRQGKVLSTIPRDGKVIVEGVNIVTRHTKPRRQTDPGGIIKKEGALYACKVMHVCPKCKKPTRAAHVLNLDGTKDRVCKHCGDTI